MNNKITKINLYTALGILTVSTGASTLVGCTKKKTLNDYPTPTITGIVVETPIVTEEVTVSPTITATPTPTLEPTQTPTPTFTPTPTMTPTPTPIPMPSSINLDTIVTQEFLNSNYFGEVKDIETELLKRREYLKKFGLLNDSEFNILLNAINRNELETGLTKEEIAKLSTILNKIINYNASNSNNIIPLSILGVNLPQNDKMLYNSTIYNCTNILLEAPKNANDDFFRDYNRLRNFVEYANKTYSIKASINKNGVIININIAKQDINNNSIYLNLLYFNLVTNQYTKSTRISFYRNDSLDQLNDYYNSLLQSTKTKELNIQ